MLTVLLLEDDALFRQSLTVTIASAGYSVCAVERSEDAVIQSQRIRPDVAIIDVMLGSGPVSGRLLEELRCSNPGLRIFLITDIQTCRKPSAAIPAWKRFSGSHSAAGRCWSCWSGLQAGVLHTALRRKAMTGQTQELKIYVVDDDPHSCRALELLLLVRVLWGGNFSSGEEILQEDLPGRRTCCLI